MYVVQKSTGAAGYLPDNQFNASLYTQVQDPAQISRLDAMYKQKIGGSTTQPQGNGEQQQWQAAWTAAPDTKTKDKIANSWKTAKGFELFGSPASSNADVQKKLDAQNSIINFIDNLEKHYQAAGGGSFGSGLGARIKGTETSVAGKFGYNSDANVYNRQKNGFVATIKELTGDTGVLTEQDAQRLKGLLPDFGSTAKESTDLLNELRSQVAAKFGREKTKTTINPQENTAGNVVNLLQALFPSTTKAVEAYQGQPQNPVSSSLPLIGLLTDQKYRENIPSAATELEAYLGLAKGAQAIAKGAVPLFSSKKAAGKAIEEAATSATKEAGKKAGVSGDKIYAEIQKVFNSATPAEKKQIGTMLKESASLKGKTIPFDVANKMLSSANDAYTAAGQIGNSAKAQVEAATSRAIRSQLPESVAAARKAYGVVAGRDKLLRGLFSPQAIGGAAAGATIYGILRSLGLGRSAQ